tara:strand:+ start:10543 stop:10875 length:333 start_codon:yes stop_codon:yes gene_type:complete
MPRYVWTTSKIINKILQLPPDKRYSTYVKKEDGALWKAAQRHFGSWKNAIEACGLDYATIIRWGPRVAPNEGSGGTCTYPGCLDKHHANGMCQLHDNMFRHRARKGQSKT